MQEPCHPDRRRIASITEITATRRGNIFVQSRSHRINYQAETFTILLNNCTYTEEVADFQGYVKVAPDLHNI